MNACMGLWEVLVKARIKSDIDFRLCCPEEVFFLRDAGVRFYVCVCIRVEQSG